MFPSKKSKFLASIIAMWYVLFRWAPFVYLKNEQPICYSPNQEFYITRHQSLWQKLTNIYPDVYGKVSLFDKTGKLLYEGQSTLDMQSGPQWYEGIPGNSDYPPKVVFEGDDVPWWKYELPKSPGKMDYSVCYDKE